MITNVRKSIWKGRFVLAAGLFGLSAVLAACGGSGATATPLPATSTPMPTAVPAQTPAGNPTPAQSNFDAQWADLLKAAQKEGEVDTFICCGTGQRIDKLIPNFEKKYGIKWVNSTGSSGQQQSKVKAEQSAGKYTLDVWMGGANSATTDLLPAGALVPIKPLIFNPEDTDPSLWYGPEGKGGFVYRDPKDPYGQQYILAYGGNGSQAEIAYNTQLVDPATSGITSYWNLLDAKWKGKIVMRDPRLNGTGASSAFYYWHPQLGPDFLKRLLTETDATYTDDARQAAEWLAEGKYSICLMACNQEVQNARQQGLPVNEAWPLPLKEGGRISVGGDDIFAPKNPPHPNAAKFFINWWLSKEGQHDYYQGLGYNSLRTDIPKDNVDATRRIDPNSTYLFLDARPDLDVNVGIKMAIDLLGKAG